MYVQSIFCAWVRYTSMMRPGRSSQLAELDIQANKQEEERME